MRSHVIDDILAEKEYTQHMFPQDTTIEELIKFLEILPKNMKVAGYDNQFGERIPKLVLNERDGYLEFS